MAIVRTDNYGWPGCGRGGDHHASRLTHRVMMIAVIINRSIGDNGGVFASGEHKRQSPSGVRQNATLARTPATPAITGLRGMRSGIAVVGGSKTRPTFAFVIESIDSDDALPVRPVLPLASTPAEISLYTIWRNATRAAQ